MSYSGITPTFQSVTSDSVAADSVTATSVSSDSVASISVSTDSVVTDSVIANGVTIINGITYYGDPSTNGTFRIFRDGTALKIQVRVANVYEDRDVINT